MDQQTPVQPQPQPKAPQPAGYEFSSSQNVTMQVLASRMKALGLIYMIFGGVVGLGGIFMLFQAGLNAIVLLLETALFGFMGFWNYNGAGSFRLIVDTRGNDISHLMNGLEQLKKIYNLQYWLMIVMLILVALAIVAMIFFAGATAGRVS